MTYKEALQNILEQLQITAKSLATYGSHPIIEQGNRVAIKAATEALKEPTERCYSEDEVINIIDKWVRYQEEVGDGKSISLEEFIQSLSPKEGKEEVKPVMGVELKQDGVSFEKFSILPESSNPIATDHTSLEPNQTEAEKEEVRKFVYLIEDTHPNRQGLWWGLEEVPLTSWETGFRAWTNDPINATQFNTFKEADEIRKKLNMDGYIVTEHEFVEMPPHEKVDSKPTTLNK